MRTLIRFSAISVLAIAAACTQAAAPTTKPSASPTPLPAATPTASPSPTATPQPSVAPTPTPAASATGSAPPSLTETFTSTINGMSVSYPTGWHLQRATEPWTGDFVQQNSPFADVINEKETDSPFIAIASQPLAGQSFDEWSNAYLAKITADDPTCVATRDPITVGGATGVLAGPCSVALVSDGQRGYLIWFYRVEDRAWVDAVLATVKLSPADAVDATPSP